MKNQEIIYLAALLHDIGKFIERAKHGIIPIYFDKTKKYRNCDKNSNYAMHKFYSAFFISELTFLDNKIEEIVVKHHLAKNLIFGNESFHLEKQIIRLSDGLSSKERIEAEEDELINIKAYYKSAFMSIFSKIKNKNLKPIYYNANELDLKTIFPDNIKGENEQTKLNAYIKNAIQKLITISNSKYLYPLFEKYLSYFPAQTPSVKHKYFPDVSLFDHLKTTAAIAVCLFKECQKNNEFQKKVANYKYAKRNNEYVICPKDLTDKYKPFILLQGDFSGIQKFIFDVESKNAAQSLKGRSVYLQILSEVITKYLIEKLELEQANIIYNGGGNFYILIPQCLEEKAKKCQKVISEIMFKAHKGDLYLAFGYTELCMNDFGNFAKKWYETRRVVTQNKINKFKETDYKIDGKSIFETFDDFENIAEEFNKNKYETEFYKSFAELTSNIKKANYVEYLKVSENKCNILSHRLPNSYTEIFNALGYEVKFYENEPEKNKKSIVYKLNCTDFGSLDGFRFMVNKLPDEQDFTKIANKSKGDNKLGLLKMDVDNLGLIFRDGLSEDDRSISRVATLSRNIHLFFEAYINTILDNTGFTKNGKRLIYPIYSGGDDLMLIGAYDKIIEIAKHIKNDFKKFTANNPKITISAALIIIDDKFPMQEAARLVEADLKKAKTISEKNRITFMGEVFTWEEFESIITIKKFLIEVEQAGDNKFINVLQKVRASTRGLEKITKNDKLIIKSVYKLMYYIRDVKTGKESLANLYKDIILDRFFGKIEGTEYFRNKKNISQNANLKIIPMACRIAEMETRKLN